MLQNTGTIHNNARNRQIGEAILAQLGGNQFVAMTGATGLGFGNSDLQMQLGKGAKNKATHCRIVLLGNDTYEVLFLALNRKTYELKQLSRTAAMADELRNVFESQTGFRTSL